MCVCGSVQMTFFSKTLCNLFSTPSSGASGEKTLMTQVVIILLHSSDEVLTA